MSSRIPGLTATLLAVAAAGCGHPERAAAKSAADAFGCSEQAIQVTPLEDDRYKAVGCGDHKVYQCVDDQCWPEGYFASKARTRASREFGCPSDQVTVRWVEHEVYRAEACGQAATYDCGDNGDCVPEGSQTKSTVVFMPVAPVR